MTTFSLPCGEPWAITSQNGTIEISYDLRCDNKRMTPIQLYLQMLFLDYLQGLLICLAGLPCISCSTFFIVRHLLSKKMDKFFHDESS